MDMGVTEKEKRVRGARTQRLKSSSKKKLSKFTPAWIVSQPSKNLDNKLWLIDRIRTGVKKNEWKELLAKIEHTEKELIHILPVSLSSMQKNSVYDKETSERIYELAMLYRLGYEIFDSKEKFREWLESPSKALNGKAPIDLLDSSFGFQLVQNEIVRIQYNVYS